MCDMPEAFRQITRTARKEHKCCECRRKIPKGTKYTYSSGIWDGTASDFKQCLSCSLVFNSAGSVSDNDEMPLFTQLTEWLGNYFYQGCDREQSVRDISRDLGLDEDVIEYVLNGRFTS